MCLIPACAKPRAAQLKGLCMACYSKAKKLVDAGTETWESLAARGLCQPPESNDPFTQAYNRSK